jgi:hypothetical protein
MRVTWKYPEESDAVLEALKHDGYEPRLVRGGIVVDVTGKAAPESEKGYLLVEASERGGGMTRTGHGTVVCGGDGRRLKPFMTFTRGHLACGEHARFAGQELYAVRAAKGSDYIEIFKVSPQEVDGRWEAVVDTLWEGDATPLMECEGCHEKFVGMPSGHNCEKPSLRTMELELPAKYTCFQAAAIAARRKARCYHCREAHYSL